MLVSIGMTILLFTIQVKDKITITMLDVGQGDGLVIRGPEGKTYFMDGGSSDVKKVGEYRIEPYLFISGNRGALIMSLSLMEIRIILAESGRWCKGKRQGVTIKRLVLPTQTVWDDALKELAELAAEEGIPVLQWKKDNV